MFEKQRLSIRGTLFCCRCGPRGGLCDVGKYAKALRKYVKAPGKDANAMGIDMKASEPSKEADSDRGE